MRVYYWFTAILIFVLILGFGEIALLRFFNKEWWQNKVIKRIAIGLLVWGIIAISMWITGFLKDIRWLANFGATSTVLMLTISLALIISLPFSGFFNWLNRLFEKRMTKTGGQPADKINRTRRIFLKGAAVAFPAVALSVTGGGLAHAFGRTNIFIQPARFENLPPELEGLRILHLSDSHLGIYKTLVDMEDIIAQADKFKPDMTLFTGDIADDLTVLPEALRIVDSLKPRFGTYAALGNHEYYRGIREVLKVFDKSEIPLLKNAGTNIKINDFSLYIAGLDDPRVMGMDSSDFHRKSVDKAIEGAPSDAFYVLMSHRPEGFDAAAEIGIDLTLSGHTHGGQIGLNRHSFWTIFMPERYLWGSYQKNGSQMYLSSGIGHWFPFRLGCPAEAPIIELTSKF